MKTQKALFAEKQPSYKYQDLGNGFADVTICLNELEKEVPISIDGDSESPIKTQKMYEYDFNSFRISDASLSEDEVSASPESYLDFSPIADSIPQLRADVDFLKIAGGYDV